MTYEPNADTDTSGRMAQIYSDLHKYIQDRFNGGGVEIMSPHYAQMRVGNRTTIPDNYLPAGYVPVALRIRRTDRHEDD